MASNWAQWEQLINLQIWPIYYQIPAVPKGSEIALDLAKEEVAAKWLSRAQTKIHLNHRLSNFPVNSSRNLEMISLTYLQIIDD